MDWLEFLLINENFIMIIINVSAHMWSFAGCSNIVWMKGRVCLLPNKDPTSVHTAPANPAKSDGKRDNICPSPVSDSNSADDDPHTCFKLLLYNSIKPALWPAGSGAALGFFTTISHIQIQNEIENQGVERRQPYLKAPAFVLWCRCL